MVECAIYVWMVYIGVKCPYKEGARGSGHIRHLP